MISGWGAVAINGKKIKGTLKRYRNDRLSVKVRFIIKDLKLAWQRAWRGFDDTAWFNYDVWFREVTLETLTIYKEKCISMWYLDDSEIAQKYVTKELGMQLLNEDAQDAIIETMIFHLRWSVQYPTVKTVGLYNC